MRSSTVILGHETIDQDRAGLADAMGSVGGLVFDGRGFHQGSRMKI